jgi:hypothetical protein
MFPVADFIKIDAAGDFLPGGALAVPFKAVVSGRKLIIIRLVYL